MKQQTQMNEGSSLSPQEIKNLTLKEIKDEIVIFLIGIFSIIERRPGTKHRTSDNVR